HFEKSSFGEPIWRGRNAPTSLLLMLRDFADERQIKEAGHMVPMDQAAVALRMLNDFLDNKLPTHHLSPPEHISLEAQEHAAAWFSAICMIESKSFSWLGRLCELKSVDVIPSTSLNVDNSASPVKEKSLLAQVESYIKRLMKGIPVILRVEHDDGSSDDEPVTKSAICTGILNRNLESVKFIPLKEEESSDDSKEPGIVIELQDVEKVICLNENHPSVVLVIPKYDRYVEIVSSGVEDFKAWYATLRMLCPEETEDDSSITDDSGEASSDSYGASSPSPEVTAKARRAMMKVNALKQIISSQGRLIDALRRDRRVFFSMLEVQNKDLVRVLKGR
ncbi:hypothetical protein FOZ63_027747, partial [Perkinsus olseni]